MRFRKLKKYIDPESYVKKTLRHIVHIAMHDIGKNGFSYVKVRKSGLFYGMMKREVRGFVPNFYTIASDDYDYDDHKDVTQDIRKRTIARAVMNYKRDYTAWKKAFRNELLEEFNISEIP